MYLSFVDTMKKGMSNARNIIEGKHILCRGKGLH